MGKGSPLLASLADEYWQRIQQEELYFKRIGGLPVDELPDISEQKDLADAAFAQKLLTRLGAVDVKKLQGQDVLTFKILRWDLRQSMIWGKYHWLIFQIAPLSSPIPLVQSIFQEYSFKQKSDLDHYSALVDKLPAFINQLQASVHEQARRGIVLPKAAFPEVEGFLSFYVQEPEKSPFYVQSGRLQAINPVLAARFQNGLKKTIQEQVTPAFQSLLDYVRGDYSKKAPQRVGLYQYPGGKEFYRALVRFSTTLDITPEEVHRIGLESVKESEARMAALRRRIAFKGSREEFHHFLQTDPRFFPKSPEEMQARLEFYLHRIAPKLPSYFLHIPKAPYEVRRLDPSLEGSEGLGHYEQPSPAHHIGIYYFNGSRLNQRSLLFAGNLALHELIPGHHFQMSLAHEDKWLPEFRRVDLQAAYSEGWGDYASWLGQEMGVYANDYDLYGMLAADMRKSVRLVVDTGMNYMGWTREQAMEYMRKHTIDSETQIQQETLRESTGYPGQALAYKMGSHEIIELRRMAEKELGDKFDIRQFHDWVLGSGAMPLDVLAKHVQTCVAEAKEKAASAPKR